MLTAIIAVTLSVPDLGIAEDAYTRWLGYRIVDQGQVSPELAAGWNAPLAAGRRYALLQPSSGEPTWLRLVQGPPTPGFEVMKTHGWNSNEILVQDPDALALQLAAGSPFRIVGEPRPLSTSPAVRAMQAIGPAGELNYFTRIPATGSVFVKSQAKSFVDRTFIVVLGGPSMAAMQAFYRDTLGAPVTAPVAAKINVLQDAYGLGREVDTPLALVNFSDRFLIELDEYPPAAIPRPRRDGDLPPGMAMVSFVVDDLDARPLPWVVPPTVRKEAPYSGRRVGMLVGPAGEWIELVAPR
jgi:catechol 2,3-dioxygenase-like lactoylglutathione lyase family enzyme